jgi:hypothetical protein
LNCPTTQNPKGWKRKLDGDLLGSGSSEQTAIQVSPDRNRNRNQMPSLGLGHFGDSRDSRDSGDSRRSSKKHDETPLKSRDLPWWQRLHNINGNLDPLLTDLINSFFDVLITVSSFAGFRGLKILMASPGVTEKYTPY